MLNKVGAFLKKSLGFVKALSLDPRIPAWDKAILASMIALLVSPVDIISDFIPVLGQLDDILIALILLDYVVNRLPEPILLDHFPWDKASLKSWRRRLRFLAFLIPSWARDRIWAIQESKVKKDKAAGALQDEAAETASDRS
jgi:uncharacterized membrane protein YkvA (DUF1232 family)